MNGVTAQIIPLIERYVACSEGMDFKGKKALWDDGDPAPLLMPEEADAPLIGWDAIDAYWLKSRQVMTSLKSRSANHRVRDLGDDLALATYDLRWIATLAGADNGKPVAADVRVTALLRRTPEGWRFFHLMEGPVDMMAMVRQAYRRQADELFPGGD